MDEKRYCTDCKNIGGIIRLDFTNHVECNKNPVSVHSWKGKESVKLLCEDKNRYNDCREYEKDSDNMNKINIIQKKYEEACKEINE